MSVASDERAFTVPGPVAAPGPPAVSGEVSWPHPYPDRLLDEAATDEAKPHAVIVERETRELTFLAALQVLPPASGSRSRLRPTAVSGCRRRAATRAAPATPSSGR